MFSAKNHTKPNVASSKTNQEDNVFFQPKLTIGKPNDKYEIEADKAADQIVAKTNEHTTSSFFTPNTTIQTQPEEEVQAQETEIQEKPLAETLTPVVQLKEAEEEEVQKAEEEQQIPEEEAIQTKEEQMFSQEALPIQQQSEEEIQEKEEDELQKQEEEELQKQAVADDAPEDTSSIEQNLNSSRGSGSAMSNDVKGEMEQGFGADFSNVNIHTDSNAVQMNQQLGAQAFTSGNDIYFNEGKYNPQSSSGKHLLAHELTHTIQQGAASVQPKFIQKNNGNPSSTPATSTPPAAPPLPNGVTAATGANGVFNFTLNGLNYTFTNPNTLTLPFIELPQFKGRNNALYNAPLTKRRNDGEGRDTSQRDMWVENITPIVTPLLNTKIDEAVAAGGFNNVEGDGRYYFFKGVVDPNLLIFGTRQELLQLAIIPTWDRQNVPTSFQVDHILEYQLGGDDDMDNFELLEASANASSGSSLMWEINRRIQAAYNVLTNNYYQTNPAITPTPNMPNAQANIRGNQFANLLGTYNISFTDFEFTLPTQSGRPNSFWSYNKANAQTDINQGAHLNQLEALTGPEVEALGHEDDPALFTLPNGGRRINISQGVTYPTPLYDRTFLQEAPSFTDTGGEIRVEAYKSNQRDRMTSVDAAYPDMTWQLGRIPGTYIYYVNAANARDTSMAGAFQSIRLPGMSPIQINSLELNANGFLGHGKVLPTVPMIRDADIDIIIDGESIRMRKLFTAQEFDFPSPFVIDQASLEVSFGTDGLGVAGRIDFGINNVGTGFVGAAASTSNGFALEGEFNFDSELFDPAQISFDYSENIWTIGGQIGIPEGKIRGVKSATITATYSENVFAATGEAELDIPGIQRGTMNVVYSDEGFSIGGTFQLKDDIPGIRGGSVSATIAKQNGEEAYSIMVSGTAQPDIPGIDSQLTVTYDNGALTIEGSAAYSRGMLAGTVQIGATNRAIGDDGQPNGDPDDTMRVYGGGSLTLTLTPWLQATAGVNFLPNGEIEVTGRIGLPSTVDVFDRQSIDRNLFSIPAIEIPIFAIPLGPRSIGIVARITGGLDFSAGFGPGQLRDLYADVTYNPDREEETTITGHGEFAIPADAGLTLRGDLGLGVSVGIASLTGGIEVAGSLGLEGEALASVDVNWSPQTGLEINALGSITVNPKFTFDINAFARASLDLWLVSISETWRYNLASFSWGPDIQFGIRFPVNYKDDEPFNMSFDDIEVIYPELDVGDMITGIARDKKNEMF